MIIQNEGSFSFYFGTSVTFGIGSRKELSALLGRNAWRRIGIVIDHNLRSLECITSIIDAVHNTGEKVVIGWCTVSEPTYEDLENLRGLYAGQDLQVIIGIGGGSALDMAKAMAVLVQNKMPAIYYRGFDRMTELVLPIIAVPTTAGTGSEVTPNASFVDAKEKRKMGINGEAVRPQYAILDPELTCSCPDRPTVSAAVDSLVHATEAYVAKKTNPLARLFAREGFQRVFNNVTTVRTTPNDLRSRSEVMYGAFLAGIALMNSGTGPAAAMSYPLGVHYRVPHGIGGGIFLPHVVRYNVRQGVEDYAELYQVIDGANKTLSRQQQAEQFVERMQKIWAELDVPNDVARFGLEEKDIDTFIAETMNLKGALDQNPVPFYEDEIRNTLASLMGTPHG